MTDHSTDLMSIVIPGFQEAEALPAFLASVRHVLQQCTVSYELVLVDDGSADTTWPLIAQEAQASSSVRGFRLSRNFGKEAALCAGLEKARGTAVIVMDGDGQHPASLLPEMIRMWQTTDADIVQAVKRSRGQESFSSKASALFFYLLLKQFSGFDLRRASDFKLMNRMAVDAWLRMGERNVFFRGMTAWMGFTTVEIPFEVAQRSRGHSTWSFFKRLKLAITGITAFSTLPLQLVTFAGALFLVFSVVLGAQTIYLKLSGQAVSGFTTVILLELIVGSFLMISLGIIGEYLARIYREVKGRPRYLISQSSEDSGAPESPK
ncbi:MAG TPA: glycosyltransferase family 2 protein [Chthoniobacterales bacterium]|nr:glycosyltransferase family 2 protein [Chthoniobacterales bacterium]